MDPKATGATGSDRTAELLCSQRKARCHQREPRTEPDIPLGIRFLNWNVVDETEKRIRPVLTPQNRFY